MSILHTCKIHGDYEMPPGCLGCYPELSAHAGEPQAGEALSYIVQERERQTAKWGVQRHDPFIWMAILTEEVGEAAEAALHHHFGGKKAGQFAVEITQVAAVAVAILEHILSERGTAMEEGDATAPADAAIPQKRQHDGEGKALDWVHQMVEEATEHDRKLIARWNREFQCLKQMCLDLANLAIENAHDYRRAKVRAECDAILGRDPHSSVNSGQSEAPNPVGAPLVGRELEKK